VSRLPAGRSLPLPPAACRLLHWQCALTTRQSAAPHAKASLLSAAQGQHHPGLQALGAAVLLRAGPVAPLPAAPSFSGHDASLRPEPWGSWCAAKHRQLARVAGLVEVFEAGPRAMDFGYMAQCAHNSGWRLEQFVGLLRPELLTEALLYWDMWELSGLLHFPRLTRLLLHDSEDLRCCVGCPSCAAWVCTPTKCQARA
jgi:hypothetical protein